LLQEDAAIAELVQEHGTKQWKTVAKMIKEKYNIKRRSAKQCRERWHNHLDPNINKEPISTEEERRIFGYHKTMGNKWAQIATILKGR
jgi:myb proto-oncogene protein